MSWTLYLCLFSCQRSDREGISSRRNFQGGRDDPRAPRGAERDRTVDLRLAKPALSQLSYSPLQTASLGGSKACQEARDAAGPHRS